MTFEHDGSGSRGVERRVRDDAARAGQSPEVLRARAELVSALEALEDKINIPRRFKRFRAARPGVVNGALAAAGSIAAGVIALVIVGAARRK